MELNEFELKLQALQDNFIPKFIDDVMVLSINEVVPVLKNRIFADGERADGNKIGAYKEGPYKKLREKKGRQTKFIDLKFEGSLQSSLQQGIDNGDVVIGFTDVNEGLKAKGLENNLADANSKADYKIFKTSNDEIILAKEEIIYNTVQFFNSTIKL